MLAGAPTRAPLTLAELLPPELSARLTNLDVVSRRVFAGKLQGERRSKRRGRSVEFDDYREYVPGDDLRHIDWNVFARLDRFFIKLFQEEEDLAVQLIIDASPSMNAGSPSKLLFAARLAMALGYIGLVRNNRVSAAIVGGHAGKLRLLTPMRGKRSLQPLAQFILDEAFVPSSGPAAPPSTRDPAADFTAAMRTLATARQGKGVAIVFSDLLLPPPPPAEGGYAAGLKLLAGAGGTSGPIGGSGGAGGVGSAGGGFDVYLIHTLAPSEIDPTRDGRVGATGKPVTASPATTPAADPNAPAATTSQDDDDASARGGLVGDLRLTDVETGRGADVTITPDLLRAYLANVERFIAQAKSFCRARGITHLLATSDADVPTLVLHTLRRNGLLG